MGSCEKVACPITDSYNTDPALLSFRPPYNAGVNTREADQLQVPPAGTKIKQQCDGSTSTLIGGS